MTRLLTPTNTATRTRVASPLALLTTICAVLAFVPAASAADGALDPSFGIGGKVTTILGAGASNALTTGATQTTFTKPQGNYFKFKGT